MATTDKLVTQVQSINDLKQIATEAFLNHTDKVSKVDVSSILDAYLFTLSKMGQKSLKEVAINESRIFPDLSSGDYLDNSADLFGVPDRLTSAQSSAFVKIKANSGTEYLSGIHKFVSTNGIEFELLESVTIDINGVGYGKLRSIQAGSNTNVDGNTITTVTPQPTGHLSCTNEFQAIGGRDNENDESFKLRIKNHPNLVAKQTIDFILEVVREVDSNILRIFNLGLSNTTNKQVISFVRENGADITEAEFSEIEDYIKDYLSISDIDLQGDTIGLEFTNVDWEYVDVDMSISILSSFDTEDVRRNIQTQMSRYLDFRYWEAEKSVEWDDLLQITKNVNGVDYVADNAFTPSSDIDVKIGSLPRVRGFIMRDLDGNILYDNGNSVLDVFYQSND